jgi:hypothetical protein
VYGHGLIARVYGHGLIARVYGHGLIARVYGHGLIARVYGHGLITTLGAYPPCRVGMTAHAAPRTSRSEDEAPTDAVCPTHC